MSELSLPPEPASASRARRLVRAQLGKTYGPDVVDVAALLATELVSNAVLHARTTITLTIEHGDDCVRLRVADGSRSQPVNRRHERDAGTGRGLAIIDQLASSWGVRRTDGGKEVWCEIRLPTTSGARGVAGRKHTTEPSHTTKHSAKKVTP